MPYLSSALMMSSHHAGGSGEFHMTSPTGGKEHSDLLDCEPKEKRKSSIDQTKEILKGLMTPIKYAKRLGDQLSLSAHGCKHKVSLHDLEASFPNLTHDPDNGSHDDAQKNDQRKERRRRRHREASCPPPTTQSRSLAVSASVTKQPPRRQMSVNELLDQRDAAEKSQQVTSAASTGTYRSSKSKSSSGEKQSRRGRRPSIRSQGEDSKDKSSRKHKKGDKDKKRDKDKKEIDPDTKERRTPRRSMSGFSARSDDGGVRRGRSSSVAAAGRSSRGSSARPNKPSERAHSRRARGLARQMSAREAFLRGDDNNNIENTASRDSTGTATTNASTPTSTNNAGRRMSLSRTESSRDVVAKAAAQLIRSNSRKNITEVMTPAERGVLRSKSRRKISLAKAASSDADEVDVVPNPPPSRRSLLERQSERRLLVEDDLDEKYKTAPLVSNKPQNNGREEPKVQPVSPKPERTETPPSSVTPKKTASNLSLPPKRSATHKADNPSSGTDSTRRETTSWSEDLSEAGEKMEEAGKIMEEADDIIDSDHEEPAVRLSPQDAAALARARAMEILHTSSASSGGGSAGSAKGEEVSYSNRSTSRSARRYQHDLAAMTALRVSSGSTSQRSVSDKQHASQGQDKHRHRNHQHSSQDKRHHRSHDKHHKHHGHSRSGGSHSHRSSGSKSGTRSGAPQPLPSPDGPEGSKWTCACGEANNGRFCFCGVCGGRKPLPKVETKWECAGCGRPDNEPRFKFCVGCGTPR